MNKTKIDIISGFLGAGKTTFIKQMLEDIYSKENVVILENEFGRINIDQETLKREGLTVKPIQARCICCSGSGDLHSGIFEIISEYQPERIIIEPTGIAKLSEIKKIMQQPDIISQCEIEHIITIVDAKNYQTRTMISKEFFEDQIRASEVIFLSKTEQLNRDKVNVVQEAIQMINPNCIVISEDWNNIQPEQLLTWINRKPETRIKLPMRLQKKHINDFDNYEIISEGDILVSWINQFARDIDNGTYGEIHRMKGICHDPIEGWYSIEAVPGEIKTTALSQDKVNSVQSQICIIGRNLDLQKLGSLSFL